MKKIALITLLFAVSISPEVISQTSEFTISVDEPKNGSITLDPVLPEDGKYAEGTLVTVTATAESGYVIDAVYHSTPGQWGPMFYDTPRVSSLQVTIDGNKSVGAYFVEESLLDGFTLTPDIIYAKPGVKPLKYDVYSPEDAVDLPILVIIHGGGWRSNDEDIMRGMARQFARGGNYVVASIDYRWLGTGDGDETPNTMADLIEDVFGAIAHIREHAQEYGGDPSRLLLTGDSAGGHLSASAATMTDRIGDGGFGETEGIYEYSPTYIPEGKTADDLRTELTSSIKGVAPTYGVFAFEGANMLQMLGMTEADDAKVAAISPIHNIPDASELSMPHYLIRGTQDPLISDENVTAYMNALVEKGQRVEYVQVGGASHAFFDWKPNNSTVDTFEKYGVYYIEEMEHFFDSVLFE
ncbi:alpha/beta hydrolase fold domain-containing protein [Rhodohalobacter sulfatireducens]|uniref:Alpha/beta hydrolase fold domain-containing protein n=1 Tax=Rhodohalobacter sulfatireducens TaxID=2911366 RepID=A0ABS9KAG4_9BACT|nr:alpha/beta fold hydrolase [Rhodohalobacter sulfatireducens]MCG2587844.1 alpha/beta hydrolase fold domain-containing protein [Rhodohalobacter sulfatireducens]